MITDNIPTLMLEAFLRASEQEQQETVMLGYNARFVLRMTENLKDNPQADILRVIREALIRGIPSLQGK